MKSVAFKIVDWLMPDEPADAQTLRGDYSQIRTDFVRKQLRHTRWRDRRYIDELMTMERALADGAATAAQARLIFPLFEKHPVEHKVILLELEKDRPLTREEHDWVKRMVRLEQNEETIRRRAMAAIDRLKEREELKRKRRRWLGEGGRP